MKGKKTGGRVKGTPNRPKPYLLAERAVYEQLIGSMKTGSSYVYAHYAGDQCFYIGKGTRGRAWEKGLGCRNPSWHQYVDRLSEMGMEYEVRIITGNLSEAEALAVEEALIKCRKPVCNIVHGGDPAQLTIAV